MTPAELYKLEPIKIESNDAWTLRHFLDGIDFDRINDIPKTTPEKEISIRYYAGECEDGERIWDLFSVWFDNIPFMICQRAGRGGYDHTECWTTNYDQQRKAESFIRSFLGIEDEPKDNVDENKDNPCLTEFYSKKLEWFYDPNLTPKYKEGDIVWAKVPRRLFHRTGDLVETRAKITYVNKFNPYRTYVVVTIDIGWNEKEKKITFCEPGQGSCCVYTNDEQITRPYTEGEKIERIEI